MENKINENLTIQMTPELETIMSELVDTSLLSSREALNKYSQLPEYQVHIKQVMEQHAIMLSSIQEKRKNNPSISDSDFYKQMMISFLTPVVAQINAQYGEILPPEKLAKINGLLNSENIIFTNDKSQNDIQADSLTGKLIINPQKTNGTTLEEKIVSSMGSAIHESFHLMINMLKSPEKAENLGERLMYKVATSSGEKEVHFAPGKYGQVLSEGFVEKISSEFAQQNNFYYTLSPSYIPCVKLCSEFMKQDPSIDMKFLFTKSDDDIVCKMTPEVKSKFEESERLFVFNNFEIKEVQNDESLKGITSDSVISSWMERQDKVQEVKKNETFRRAFEVKKEKNVENSEIKNNAVVKKEPEFKTFKYLKTQREHNQSEITNHEQQKAEFYETQRAENNKQNENSNSSSFSRGFVNVFILTLIIGFVAGTIFTIIYCIFK